MKIPNTGNEAKSVKAPVKKLLDKHDWFWWSPPMNGYGMSGVADINAVKRGMFMVVETKFGKRDPTPMQKAFLDSVRAADHFAFVVRETTLDAFEMFLQYLDKSIEVSATGAVPSADIGGPMMDAIRHLFATEVLNMDKFRREADQAERIKNARRRMGTN